MKIGVIHNLEENRHELTMLGRLQAGYLIQVALGWFGCATEDSLRLSTSILTSESAEDMEPAFMAANAPNMGITIRTKILQQWGCGGDLDQDGTNKGAWLADYIEEFTHGKENILMFGFFSHDGEILKAFLAHWGMEIPKNWPIVYQPHVAMIDTEAKTIEFDLPPFPPARK